MLQVGARAISGWLPGMMIPFHSALPIVWLRSAQHRSQTFCTLAAGGLEPTRDSAMSRYRWAAPLSILPKCQTGPTNQTCSNRLSA
jgi:hypothetical protein